MRGKIISIGSRIKKQRTAKKQELEIEIKRLDREYKQHRKEDTFKKLKEVKPQLDGELTYKAEGALRYINRKYCENGNKQAAGISARGSPV